MIDNVVTFNTANFIIIFFNLICSLSSLLQVFCLFLICSFTYINYFRITKIMSSSASIIAETRGASSGPLPSFSDFNKNITNNNNSSSGSSMQ